MHRRLISQAGAPLPFTAGERFRGIVHGLLTHLAGVCEHPASPAVEPSWVDVLDRQSARVTSAPCRFWAASMTYHRLGGHPVATFGQAPNDAQHLAAGVEP